MVQDVIQECCRDCTIITVSHKLKHLMKCDMVVVIDNGRVVELGEPSLLAANAQSSFSSLFLTSAVS